MSQKLFELSDENRKTAIDKIRVYFHENMEEPIGDLKAELLLDFLVENIGAIFYNQGVTDTQVYMAEKIDDIYGLLK